MINHQRRFLLFAYLLAYCVPAWCVTPQLESDTDVATAGYYRLQWTAKDSSDFILEESQQDTFDPSRKLYQGPDTARVISGRNDGDYYYRVRGVDTNGMENTWSDVVHVQVSHHPLSRALMFFFIGAIVFLATLVVIIVGSRHATNK